MMAAMIDFERIDHEAENDEKERENGMSTHHNYLEWDCWRWSGRVLLYNSWDKPSLVPTQFGEWDQISLSFL